MGYTLSSNGHYYHRGRMAIFVGDYIDRGPQSRDVCRIVRGMVESESAIALMGNHEYNAICFHTLNTSSNESNEGYLRKHNLKNIKQHYETLESYNHQEELEQDIVSEKTYLKMVYEGNWDDDEYIVDDKIRMRYF